ncbi:globin [Corynebacterium felinum]|uniref:Hemoglobin n=1 Tax=Corynebacterium felinum TaxID=131318 RepID=A0ABU2B4U3_9CORY|nr:globin [Corynebacterium felinum]MDF5820866.1 globin [Corynebacterium felinum]MDR7353630.1 hemoglobin [Corynebacterium felinum]WJY95809.1 Group 2 truncated hemoglobin GlbO [Corynebacterium felinum]
MKTPLGDGSQSPTNSPESFYEAVGGEELFKKVVHLFYQEMKTDDLIGPMYPHDDWEGAEDRLRWFLVQYWGGPQTFSEQRGHPRLRMRHAHFPIGEKEAQRWLDIMGRAMDQVEMPEAHRHAMWDHMERVAAMLINRAT